MHEFSIAEAVLDLAKANVPEGSVLTTVKMEAGPMRGIEPDAMEWAWQALTEGMVELDLVIQPWMLQCRDCGKTFAADDNERPCACGSARTAPVGGDDLKLISIDVDDVDKAAADAAQGSVSHASQSR